MCSSDLAPLSAAVALARVGVRNVEVKLFGPLHEYVAPPTRGVLSEIVAPSQYGPPFDGAGAAVVLTATIVVPAAEVQPLTVTVTEYVPASAAAAFARVGFCCEEVKPFGPLQAYVAVATAGVESEIVPPTQ